jgi:hypothetical protein
MLVATSRFPATRVIRVVAGQDQPPMILNFFRAHFKAHTNSLPHMRLPLEGIRAAVPFRPR